MHAKSTCSLCQTAAAWPSSFHSAAVPCKPLPSKMPESVGTCTFTVWPRIMHLAAQSSHAFPCQRHVREDTSSISTSWPTSASSPPPCHKPCLGSSVLMLRKRPHPTCFIEVHVERPPHLPGGTFPARVVLVSRLKTHPTFSRAAVSPACWWPCQLHAVYWADGD